MRWTLGVVLALLSLVCGAETLSLGFSNSKPPFIFAEERRGLEYDIIVAAAQRAGFTVEPYIAPMERLHRMLERHEIDAISSTNRSSGLAAYYSEPVVFLHNVAITLASHPLDIKSIADLKRYSVSTFQRARFLLGPEFRAMAANHPQYREEAEQFRRNLRLYAGRVDVVVADVRIFHYFNTLPEVTKLVDVHQPILQYAIFPPTDYRVAFHDERQRDRFNQALAELRASGDYARIEARYAEYGP